MIPSGLSFAAPIGMVNDMASPQVQTVTNVGSANCAPGTLPGEGGVSCTGAATYSIPINVPPGTFDVQPLLSLNYNSQAGDGLVGMGWSVNGLSSITRCSANMGLDGFRGSVNYDSDDKYCLDGQRLIPIGPPSGGVQDYKTEPETFSRIKSYGTTSTNADYFIVEAKAGSITEYGKTADSKIEAQGAATNTNVRVWAANKYSDHKGNYIKYSYIENNANGEYRINDIAYTGNTNTGLLPYNFVKFDYTDRVAVPFYQGGSFVATSRLLSKIRTCLSNTCTGADLVNSYSLAYQDGFATKRARLVWVEECDTTGQCLPKTTMNWSDQTGNLKGNTKSSSNIDTTWATGFGNSDGSFMHSGKVAYGDAFFPNFSALQSAPDTKSMVIATTGLALGLASLIVAPWASAIIWIASGLVAWFKQWYKILNHDIIIAELGDVNGDGKTDVVGFAKAPLFGDPPSEHVWLSTELYSGGGYNFNKNSAWETLYLRQVSNNVPEADEVKLGDFNGDGLMDVMNFESPGSTLDGIVYTSNGSNAFTHLSGNQAGAVGKIDETSFGDFNGDGKTDIAQFFNNGHIFLNDGTKLNVQPSWASCQFIGLSCGNNDLPIENVLMGDVNGDGKTDVVRFDYSNPTKAYVWFTNKNATGWTASSPTVFNFGFAIVPHHQTEPDIILPGDFNGDGKMDLALFQADTSQTKYDTNGDGTIDNKDVTVRETWFYVYYSTGDSKSGSVPFVKANYTVGLGGNKLSVENAPYALDYLPATDLSFLTRIADFNGDGKSDLITFDPTKQRNARLLLSDGNKLRTPFVWGGGFGKIDEDYLGDFDGDGRTDVLQFSSGSFDGQLHVTTANSYPFPDLMTRVTDGYGKKDEFDYMPLTDDRVYKGHTSLAGFDSETINFRGPMYVVYLKSSSNGNNGMYQQVYSYKGAKLHRSYGFLGFSEIKVIDYQAQKTDTTQYEQAYPLTCHKKGSVTRTYIAEQEGPVVSSQLFNWSATSGPAPHIIRLNSQNEEQREPNGALTKSVVINYTYDIYNNVTNTQINWPDVGLVRENITETFLNLTAPPIWMLGLPQSTTITMSQPIASPARVINRVFDPATGLMDSITRNLEPSGKTITTAFERDSFGNIKKVTVSGSDISTRISNITYDAKGRFPAVLINPLNQVTLTSFESKYGKLSNITDPNSLATTFAYDGFGREILQTRPGAVTTTTEYCPASESSNAPTKAVGWVRQKTSGSPDTTVFYDLRAREIRSSKVGFDGTAIFTDKAYNDALQLKSYTFPYFKGSTVFSTALEYDAQGRLSKQTPPVVGSTTYTYSGGASLDTHPLTNLTSRLLWRKVTMVNPLNQKTDYFVNRLDQVNQVVHRNNNNGLMSKMTYDIDGFNNQVKAADANGNIATRIFENDLVKDLTDPDLGHWTYAHNALGEVTAINDPKGNHIFATYDLLGRIKTKTDQGVDTWTYDMGAKAIGKISHLHSWNNFDEGYTYDSLGRLFTTSTLIPGDSNTYTTVRSYDTAGRLDVLRYPPGNTGSFEIKHHYSATGYLSSITDNTTSSVLWKVLSKNAFGYTTTKEQGNIGTRFSYDGFRTPIKKIEFGWTKAGIPQTPYKRLEYAYDVLGKVGIRFDTTGPTVNISEIFGYDALNRLTSVNSFTTPVGGGAGTPLESRSFQYDQLGNMTFDSNLSNLSPNLFYGPTSGAGPHALVSACDPNLCSVINYDANGNRTLGWDFLNDAGHTINWYTFDKPSSISESTRTAAFTYNPLREKIKQVETGPSGTTTTLYVNKLFEKVTLPNGVVLNKHYLYGTSSSPEGMLTLRNSFPPNWKYFSYDNLNSLSMIYDPSVGVVENLSFDSFGARRNPNWTKATTPITSLSNYGYTSHEQVDGFGLIDMKGRMYDSSTNHFVSADPYIVTPLLSENANRYSYVYNNPINNIDPTGYQVIPGGTLEEVVIQGVAKKAALTAGTSFITASGSEIVRLYATHSAPVSTRLQSGSILTNTYDPKTGMYNETVTLNELEISADKVVPDKPFISGPYNTSWENLGYHMRNLDRAFDGRYNGTGLPPAPVRVVLSFLPPVALVNGGKTILTGEDLYEREANSFLERWVFAPVSVIAPFGPEAVVESVPFIFLEDAHKVHTMIHEAPHEHGAQEPKKE